MTPLLGLKAEPGTEKTKKGGGGGILAKKGANGGGEVNCKKQFHSVDQSKAGRPGLNSKKSAKIIY